MILLACGHAGPPPSRPSPPDPRPGTARPVVTDADRVGGELLARRADGWTYITDIPGHERILIGLAEGPDESIQILAVQALGEMHIEGAVPTLLRILERPVPTPPEDRPRCEDGARVSDPPWDREDERSFVAGELHAAAARALSFHSGPQVSRALEPLLGTNRGSKARETRGAAYRALANAGGAHEIAVLAALDARTQPLPGWRRACLAGGALENACPPRAVGAEARVEAGPYTIWSEGRAAWSPSSRLWIRRDDATSPTLDRVETVEARILADASIRGGQLRVRGRNSREEPLRTVAEIDLRGAFADPDRDGITSPVEALFGTDPADPDTDRDGVLDGDDGSPLAAPRPSAETEVVSEVIRYTSRYHQRVGVAEVDSLARSFGEAHAGVGLVLHTSGRAPPRVDTRFEFHDLDVVGDRASLRATAQTYWSYRETRFKLRAIGDTWRVIEEHTLQHTVQ